MVIAFSSMTGTRSISGNFYSAAIATRRGESPQEHRTNKKIINCCDYTIHPLSSGLNSRPDNVRVVLLHVDMYKTRQGCSKLPNANPNPAKHHVRHEMALCTNMATRTEGVTRLAQCPCASIGTAPAPPCDGAGSR